MGRRRLASAFLIPLALLSAAIGRAGAEDRDFAVGAVVGSPTGLSLLQNLDSSSAIQAALAWDLSHSFVAQADYLFKEKAPLVNLEPAYGRLFLYYGPGVRAEIGERSPTFYGPYRRGRGGVALRFPAGVQYYLPPKVPLDVFYEVAPMLDLLPRTQLDLGLALGIRFDL